MNNKILIGIVVVVIIILGVMYMMRNQYQGNQTVNTPAPTFEANTPLPAVSKNAEKEETINASADGFTPAAITIKAGVKVTWVNKSGADISINSDPHPTHTLYPPLNLGRVADDGSVSLVFDKSGTYGYHNHLDASQRGTVIVE